MPPDPFAIVAQGEPLNRILTHQWWNAVTQHANPANQPYSISSQAGGSSSLPYFEFDAVSQSTDEFSPYDVVKISDPRYDPNDEQKWKFKKPVFEMDNAATGESFGILQKYVKGQGGVTSAVVHGYTLATVNITDTNHRSAGPETGESVLQSGRDGCEIFWKPNGTGEKLCIVILGHDNTRLYLAVTRSEVQPGSTNNTVDLLEWHDASSTSLTLTGVKFDFITDDETISAGKQVIISEQYGVRRIVGAECDEEAATAFIAPAMSSLRI